MFYQPELIIYLWMLPVIAMVVLPALGAMSRALYRAVEHSRLADVRGFIDLNTMEFAGLEENEKRRHPRIRIEGPKAKVAKHMKCCQTFMANISRKGVCFTNIPQKMYAEADDKLRVVFRTRERDYTMLVQTKWRKKGGNGYILGGEIINVSAGWNNFVDGLCRPVVAQAA